ncbi:hypothetical protein JTB14_031849 [Gonioctena quinquepunctata]|nr:hypothetical protein JTB14_031849 [Gonioctena quinquepunctata]
MSSKGLEFQKGSIGEGNNSENPKPMVNIVENANSDTEMANEVHDREKKTERPNARATKKEKFTEEYELFENLVEMNNDGLLAIANGLESVATANNNIANALLQINDTLEEMWNTLKFL